MNLTNLNTLPKSAFVATLGAIFEHSPWVAEGAYAAKPFADIEALRTAMVKVVDEAGLDQQLALIRAHPEVRATLGPLEHAVLEGTTTPLLAAQQLLRAFGGVTTGS